MPEETPSPSSSEPSPDNLHPDLRRYHEQYEGLARGQLQQRDQALYQRLRRAGLLEEISTKYRQNDA